MSSQPESQDTEVVQIAQGAIGAMIKSETEAQLDAAHKYPRSIKKFLDEAITLATFSEEIAESCIYSLPRDGKIINGPSVRLAEICASAYGNLHVGARVVGIEDRDVVSQGVAWDLEKNLRVTIEKRRRITTKEGRRFKDDMITVTGNAAASIGLRDAIFRTIPKAYVYAVYDRAKDVAIGNASTLVAKRQRVIDGLMKMGLTKERILAPIGKHGLDDIGLGELETLVGLANAIKGGDVTADEAFPMNFEPTKGVVDINSIKAGKEENRGHGNEHLKSDHGQAGETGSAPSTSVASGPCDKSDFDQLEIIGTENGVGPKKWKKHIEETMGFKNGWEFLTKDRVAEVRRWIEAHAPKTQA